MPPERILVVIDGMEVGGSQRQITHLLAGLDRSRWQPELVYFREPSFLVDALVQAGITVHQLPKRGRLDLRFLLAFAALLRRGDYALVHAFSLTAELWSVLAVKASGRRPALIASERNQYLDKPSWYWWLKRFVLRHCAAVIANSKAGAVSTARRTRMPPSLFDVVVNGVDNVPPPAGTLHVIPGFVVLMTVAEMSTNWLGIRFAEVRDGFTAMSAVTVTVADPDLVGSATLVATT